MVFANFSNCTINLRGVNGYTSDGFNEVPNQVTFAVRAMLEATDPKILLQPGVDVPTAKFKGYLTEPMPEGVTLPQTCEVTFDSSRWGREFTVISPIPSPFFDEVTLLGTPIELQ